MLIRIPTAPSYALKIQEEQNFLPKFAPYISINIPKPIALGKTSAQYPFPFSIYQWLEGQSVNLIALDQSWIELAKDVARFLKKLQSIQLTETLLPGQHNFWRGAHVSMYRDGFIKQINQLKNEIPYQQSLSL